MDEAARGRLEAFSDGVFAIAATLLILEIRVPDVEGADLGDQLLHLWPSYLAYATSFLTIGIIWINHHACVSCQAGRPDAAVHQRRVPDGDLVHPLPHPAGRRAPAATRASGRRCTPTT
jgi:hypothetical protein